MIKLHGIMLANTFSARSLMIAISLIVLSSMTCACVSQNQPTNTKRASSNMKFKFEDYDVKLPEAAQAKLTQLFPKGSSIYEFKNEMERAGANCDLLDASDGENSNNSMYCRHLAGNNPFVKSKWIVKIKIGNDNNIEELTVSAGLVGT